MTTITRTARTLVREVTTDDAAFICELLNQPSFLRFIGDRNVRTPADAATFIETRYRQSYRDHGYGLYVVAAAETQVPMGLCGYVRRNVLPAPDMGFAFLPEYEGHGYAFEAASAVLEYGRTVLAMRELLAIAQPDNTRSHRLLERLGFRREGELLMPGDTIPVVTFVLDLERWPHTR